MRASRVSFWRSEHSVVYPQTALFLEVNVEIYDAEQEA